MRRRFGTGTLGAFTCALLATGWAITQGIAEPAPIHVPTSAAALVDARLPDGSVPPREVIRDAVSVTGAGDLARGGALGGDPHPGLPPDEATRIVVTASTNSIPSAALAAYQRAAAVINAADQDCNISWQLIAAIGRVESDHGRYGGNTLDDDGVAQPGIYGVALDGTGGTRAIPDTDAGQYDNDTVWDRAVGPMQFIPSTWSIVAVDADGDGVRNPQDIDDAALAAAVYLCSGNEDLSGTPGSREALLRYNRSTSYADLVLRVTDAYSSGDYSPAPNNTFSAMTLSPKVVKPTSDEGNPTHKGRGKQDTATLTVATTKQKSKPKKKVRLEQVPATTTPPAPTPPAAPQPPVTPPPTTPPADGGPQDGEDNPLPGEPGCDPEVADPDAPDSGLSPGADSPGTGEVSPPGVPAADAADAQDGGAGAEDEDEDDECDPPADDEQAPGGGDGPEQPEAREQS
ncbi:lytic transglycosylase domain-containing protein [Nocardioides sp.]|uniref:lytic transglycosylase domain-containing protein n=1 Tax=Nocardioides sp. TaxID=35761 RepID=UPI002735BD51|nr:lytic transglycosylase domain-containing protein [Nocardioides sp.]MDP3893733.1 lytic transglycosylase domain-containing protein [Nocardioides sp.]